MKQMLQDVAQRMGQKSEDANLNYKVSARQTGQSKVVSGLNAQEMVLYDFLTRTYDSMLARKGKSTAQSAMPDKRS